ncbi:hypothetical protein [Maribacter sp. 2307ULW6-5]|uniref:hypothetical protein n=1 Tax=Maribacter sp. 2307ULW6-5 TaxID=3386275 RepID=UPI0039BC763D
MKQKMVFHLFALVCNVGMAFAQAPLKESLFAGAFRGHVAELYIQTHQQDCTNAPYYLGMVRFKSDDTTEAVWRKFNIFANDANGFLLVDDHWNVGRFQHYIYLEQKGPVLTGFLKASEGDQEPLKLERKTTVTDFGPYHKEMLAIDMHDDC